MAFKCQFLALIDVVQNASRVAFVQNHQGFADLIKAVRQQFVGARSSKIPRSDSALMLTHSVAHTRGLQQLYICGCQVQ